MMGRTFSFGSGIGSNATSKRRTRASKHCGMRKRHDLVSLLREQLADRRDTPMHPRLDRRAPTLSTKVLYSIDEAATMLSLGRTAVYDLVMRQEIVSVKVGRTRRVPLYALHAFVRNLAKQ